MPLIATQLNNTRESARLLRTEVANGVTQTNVQKALEQLAAQPPVIIPTPVAAGQSPYTPLATDTTLYVDSSAGPVQILLRLAAERGGVPITVKDVGGAAYTKNITITPNGAETIETNPNFVIQTDFGGVNLNPRSGVGYVVAP